jgi:hypothetical protein
MSRVIQIADTLDGVFVHVTDVLSLLEPEATKLGWVVLDLREAFAPQGSDLDVLAVQQQVEQAPTGLHLTFDELQRLAAGLQQVVDGLAFRRGRLRMARSSNEPTSLSRLSTALSGW